MKKIELTCAGDYIAAVSFVVGVLGALFYVVPNLLK